MPDCNLYPSTVRRDSVVTFTRDELNELYEVANSKFPNGKPMYIQPDAYKLIANTGLREGELLALTLADIDFENKVAFIRKSVMTERSRDSSLEKIKGNNLKLSSTKTKTSRRVVPLNDEAIKCINNLLSDDKIKRTNNNPEYIFIVSNEKGEMLSTNAFRKRFSNIRNRCNFEQNHTIHDLRRTFASILANEINAPVKKLKDIMGHSSIEITEKYYLNKSDVAGLTDNIKI